MKTKKTLPEKKIDKGGATAQSPPKPPPRKPSKTHRPTKPTRK